jgi:hypothetical protein
VGFGEGAIRIGRLMLMGGFEFLRRSRRSGR